MQLKLIVLKSPEGSFIQQVASIALLPLLFHVHVSLYSSWWRTPSRALPYWRLAAKYPYLLPSYVIAENNWLIDWSRHLFKSYIVGVMQGYIAYMIGLRHRLFQAPVLTAPRIGLRLDWGVWAHWEHGRPTISWLLITELRRVFFSSCAIHQRSHVSIYSVRVVRKK